tara:strand:- start:248 stop:583 length:336 start_codon:yes stop_codon:yes gene_type:complete
MPTDSGVLANRVLDELEVMVFNGNFNSLEKLVNYVDSSYGSGFTDYIYEDLEDLWQEYEDSKEPDIEEQIRLGLIALEEKPKPKRKPKGIIENVVEKAVKSVVGFFKGLFK